MTQNIDFETGKKLLISEMDESYARLRAYCESEYLLSVNDEKERVDRIVWAVDRIHDLKSSWLLLLKFQDEKRRSE